MRPAGGQGSARSLAGRGYWYLADFVPADTAHPSFPRPEPQAYYEAALRRLRDLQNWFVNGRSPYLPHHAWPDL